MADLLANVQERVAMLMAVRQEHYVEHAALEAVDGGKLLRPRLLITAAGESADRETVVSAAAAVELLHAALLIHDDLIDGDQERRGRPSVTCAAIDHATHAGFGRDHALRVGLTTAVVTGDILLSKGLGELARIDVPVAVRRRVMDIIDRALAAAATGEFDDVWHAGLSPDEHLITALLERKTADYSFRAPLEIGALVGRRSDEAVEQLGSIGLRMGVLYQLRDDVLGTFGDEDRIGKSPLSDLRTGAPTLLVHLAAKSTVWRDVANRWGDPLADHETLDRIRSVLRESGAVTQLRERMDREVEVLRAEIAALPVEREAREEFERLLLRTVERTR